MNNTLATNGQYTITLRPDIVEMTLRISSTRSNMLSAKTVSNKKRDYVLYYLKMNEKYLTDYRLENLVNSHEKLKQFTSTILINAELNNLNLYNQLTSILVEKINIEVLSPKYGFSSEYITNCKHRAAIEAMFNARKKAKLLLKTSGSNKQLCFPKTIEEKTVGLEKVRTQKFNETENLTCQLSVIFQLE
ncbi:hypothetical protein SNEBB_000898 [Seison nebaliae]|nr:hypothetical protein SNEBB_000898 [Seison nebaliae]